MAINAPVEIFVIKTHSVLNLVIILLAMLATGTKGTVLV